jgi:UDP-glucose 4-epimerase
MSLKTSTMSTPENTSLVTGGAGYIAAHACKALRSAGYAPVVSDNLVYGHDRAVKWGPFERGDTLDPESSGRCFKTLQAQNHPLTTT